MKTPDASDRPAHNVLRAIVTDAHFWIPLIVLVAGLVLLDKLS